MRWLPAPQQHPLGVDLHGHASANSRPPPSPARPMEATFFSNNPISSTLNLVERRRHKPSVPWLIQHNNPGLGMGWRHGAVAILYCCVGSRLGHIVLLPYRACFPQPTQNCGPRYFPCTLQPFSRLLGSVHWTFPTGMTAVRRGLRRARPSLNTDPPVLSATPRA